MNFSIFYCWSVLKFSSLILLVLNIFMRRVTYSIRMSSPVIMIFWFAGVAAPLVDWLSALVLWLVPWLSLALAGDLLACLLWSTLSWFLLGTSLFFGAFEDVDLFGYVCFCSSALYGATSSSESSRVSFELRGRAAPWVAGAPIPRSPDFCCCRARFR